jgi:hypothetical protein
MAGSMRGVALLDHLWELEDRSREIATRGVV